MIIVNFTGLDRTYWLPVVEHESDNDGLWFVIIRWLGVEVTCFSIMMGTAFVDRLNKEEHPCA